MTKKLNSLNQRGLLEKKEGMARKVTSVLPDWCIFVKHFRAYVHNMIQHLPTLRLQKREKRGKIATFLLNFGHLRSCVLHFRVHFGAKKSNTRATKKQQRRTSQSSRMHEARRAAGNRGPVLLLCLHAPYTRKICVQ
jgi:hypothetical protein